MSTTVLALNNPSSHYPPWGSLADKLSPGASLHLPNDTGFKTVAGDVWSEQLTQQIPRAVISVATEEDILASVRKAVALVILPQTPFIILTWLKYRSTLG